MNTKKLQQLVLDSKLTKVQIAEKCGFTRVTLDNALQGADVKISTIENLAKVLGVSPACFFDDSNAIVDNEIDLYKKEIERLQTLLNTQSKPARVLIELDVNHDEFIKMGLKDKVIQILNK